ncbi:hypothetical protein MA16_Dca021592 [Dendrobium catenatum]|uniref:Uncharacterized protein n=1 Tax=Dendrobium catenatum TaxID=906689 RepID=A0A2I0VKR6_9ASPA|nr:hypothetical protein MA16_Dca021592 [Dendrobium catenatum]
MKIVRTGSSRPNQLVPLIGSRDPIRGLKPFANRTAGGNRDRPNTCGGGFERFVSPFLTNDCF